MLTPTDLIHTGSLNLVIPGSTDALAHSDATTKAGNEIFIKLHMSLVKHSVVINDFERIFDVSTSPTSRRDLAKYCGPSRVTFIIRIGSFLPMSTFNKSFFFLFIFHNTNRAGTMRKRNLRYISFEVLTTEILQITSEVCYKIRIYIFIYIYIYIYIRV